MYTQIKEALTEAMKSKDSLRVGVLRSLLSEFTNELVAQGKTPQDEVDDDTALTVIKRQAKQRKDSINQFENAGRGDLAEKEKQELEILEDYLPEMMSKEKIEKIARAKKEELGVDDKSKMGMLVGAVMRDLKGKADGGDVKEVVEQLF